MKPINIVVTGAGSLFGQGIIRSLRRGDLPARIVGLDYFDDAIGFHWCDEWCLLPDFLDPAVSEAEWVASLKKNIQTANADFVFVGVDFELLAIAQHRSELEQDTGCRIVVSSQRVIETCQDKYATAKWLESISVPQPLALLPGDQVAGNLSPSDYPLMVKPRFSSRSRGLHLVETRQELDDALKRTPDPLIQGFLPGTDNEYSCGVVVLDGAVDSISILNRKLKDGNTSWAKSSDNNTIRELCVLVGEKLNPFGPINIQLKLVDGRPYIFEINPRFSGTTIFRTHLGVNEPIRIMKRLAGQDVAGQPSLRPGTVVRYFDEIVVDAVVQSAEKHRCA